MAARTDSAAAAPGPATSDVAPLPPGWTQHTAPSGHVYFYNAQTKESTYRRPTALPPPPPPPPPPPLAAGFSGPGMPPVAAQGLPILPGGGGAPTPAPFLRLSDPRVANAFLAQQQAAAGRGGGGGGGGRGPPQNNSRPRPQPHDKPRSRVAIPGCEPWVLVYTKYGRRFVHNPAKKASYWRIPEKLMPAILELDKERLRQRSAPAEEKKKEEEKKEKKEEKKEVSQPGVGGDDSEYEEVEVWEDAEGRQVAAPDDGHASKRRKVDGGAEAAEGQGQDDKDDDDDYDYDAHQPVEFSEADIAFQLAAAGAEDDDFGAYEYDDDDEAGEGGGGGGGGGGGEAAEGGEGGPDEPPMDPVAVFQSLLDDKKINPFGAWDTLVEDGTLVDDPRYTALHSMKARRAAWEDWSRARIRAVREAKARAAAEAGPRDPRRAFLDLLQAHATPKLYWPEFRRKHRREPAVKDTALPDREKERLYREFVARRRLPTATQRADLAALLRSLPADVLVPHGGGGGGGGNTDTDPAPADLPAQLVTDMRYVAVDAAVRDPLVAAFLQTAGPAR